MQRRLRNADLNEFFSATVSARALIMRLPIFTSLAHRGTSPQCKVSTRRTDPDSSTAYTSRVGATL